MISIIGYSRVDGAALTISGDHSQRFSLVVEKGYLGLGSSRERWASMKTNYGGVGMSG
jgi:hypothetical protein